jgi:hypothetical protein
VLNKRRDLMRLEAEPLLIAEDREGEDHCAANQAIGQFALEHGHLRQVNNGLIDQVENARVRSHGSQTMTGFAHFGLPLNRID